MRLVHVDVADRVVVLVEEVDLVPALHDLKRERHVRDARHAGQVALRFRIGGPAGCGGLLLLCAPPGLVRDLLAPPDPPAGGEAPSRPHTPEGPPRAALPP